MPEHAVVRREEWEEARKNLLEEEQQGAGSSTVLLLTGAAVAWVVTVERMRGMDSGPGVGLGGWEWYLGVWVAMTAAMMLPTALPAAHFARVRRASPAILFAAAYLAVWTAFGISAYALFRNELDTGIVAAVVVGAGIYELTPLKQRSLRRCRSRHGSNAAFRSGLAHGFDCVGCSGGLMVVLIVLGLMSLLWMVVVAAAIFAEKVLPKGPRVSPVIAAGLVALGIWLAVSPESIPS